MLKRHTRDNARIMQGDVLEWCETYAGPKFHALLADPPYLISFMGKNWDKSGITFNSATWQALSQHLLPGAFGMVFASARGYHRVACAIEDAGLIIHPSIFGWCYGSGFPKATRIDTQLDKKRNVERPVVGYAKGHTNKKGVTYQHYAGKYSITSPSTDPAKAWEHHRYGLQALKPALEPVIVFQKPYDGKPLDSIVKHGSGAINIDASRIEYEVGGDLASNPSLRSHIHGGNGGYVIAHEEHRRVVIPNQEGRWPANFYVDKEAAKRLDKQSGFLVSGNNATRRSEGKFMFHGGLGKPGDVQTTYGDSGGASRFFFNVESQIDKTDPVYYCAKASKKERNAGLSSVIPRETIRYGSMTTQGPRPQNTPRLSVFQQNTHPTLKPLSLCQWLATLLLPPESYAPRRLLVPFSGTSSEMIGGLQAGWDRVLGIEQEEEYVIIAKKRISYWIPKK